jgi:hypothetical protein
VRLCMCRSFLSSLEMREMNAIDMYHQVRSWSLNTRKYDHTVCLRVHFFTSVLRDSAAGP